MSYVYPPYELIRARDDSSDFANGKNAAMIAEQIEELLLSYNIVVNVNAQSFNSNAIFCDVNLGGVSKKAIQALKTEIEVGLGYSIEILSIDSDILRIAVKDNSRHLVPLGNLINSPEFKSSSEPMKVAIGLDLLGDNYYLDIKKARNILINGATGAGKSVLISNIVVSLLYKANPDDLSIIMIDTCGNDLTLFNGIPLIMDTVGTSVDRAFNRLDWLVSELDRRKSEDIHSEKDLLLIIDEFSDLINSNKKHFESIIEKIAAEGSDYGIYMILSTQVPSSKVITPVINASVPFRISFVSFDNREAKMRSERLVSNRFLGQGDMFISATRSDQGVHVQGAYANYREIDAVIKYSIEYSLNDN